MTHIDAAAQRLREGGVVAFPTETVYGLGADATSADACLSLFALKKRPRFNPLIVHVPSLDAAKALTTSFPPLAQQLARAFWPGPLTLVLPKHPVIADVVTAGLPTVGLRVPRHPVALALLEKAQIPVAAPSANLFMTVSPTTAQHVEQSLGKQVGMILDGGPCEVGLESTIIGFFEEDKPVLLRRGGLEIEKIEKYTGPLAAPSARTPLAPGMLARHYAPTTPLKWWRGEEGPVGRAGLLCLKPPCSPLSFLATESLSQSGDLKEAAKNFFASFRRLDALKLETIYAERLPEEGLGLAMNDRLSRAMG